ncbi:MAG: SAP domain-containing protein [Selenomonas sp.]|uniref:SAP domain-containing protein n=1 Tax=Selenomonas sp. TaxID=2053611 RepID=UPI0025D5FBFB|nr:SAP domain-containing protein [Selenomonas sp.]MCR5439824.1 SAP domain-containing protein [Selenomonas sp.]
MADILKEYYIYYWYRDELIKICRDHGLDAPSGKIKINKVIEAYFAGKKDIAEAEEQEEQGSCCYEPYT